MKIDEHRLAVYVAAGKKYLDTLWDAIASKRDVWTEGRIRLWLAPRLGRPPWLCAEIWAKYAADRKAAEKHGQTPQPGGKPQAQGVATPTATGQGEDSQKPAKPATDHPSAAGKGKRGK